MLVVNIERTFELNPKPPNLLDSDLMYHSQRHSVIWPLVLIYFHRAQLTQFRQFDQFTESTGTATEPVCPAATARAVTATVTLLLSLPWSPNVNSTTAKVHAVEDTGNLEIEVRCTAL